MVDKDLISFFRPLNPKRKMRGGFLLYHKNSLAVEFPTLLIISKVGNSYTQQLEILVTAFHIYISLL